VCKRSVCGDAFKYMRIWKVGSGYIISLHVFGTASSTSEARVAFLVLLVMHVPASKFSDYFSDMLSFEDFQK